MSVIRGFQIFVDQVTASVDYSEVSQISASQALFLCLRYTLLSRQRSLPKKAP